MLEISLKSSRPTEWLRISISPWDNLELCKQFVQSLSQSKSHKSRSSLNFILPITKEGKVQQIYENAFSFQLNSSFHHYGFAYQKSDIRKQWTRDNKYILKIQLFTFLKDLFQNRTVCLLASMCLEIILQRYRICLPIVEYLFLSYAQLPPPRLQHSSYMCNLCKESLFLIDTNCFSVLLNFFMKGKR